MADELMSQAAKKLVDGLRARGVTIIGDGFTIWRKLGQPMMNKAAGEIAPTWYLRCYALRRGRRQLDAGEAPHVEYDGRAVAQAEVCSFLPLGWILSRPLREWEIAWDLDFCTRLMILTPGNPPNRERW